MDHVALAAGLPVTLTGGLAGLYVMSVGRTVLGITLLGLSVLATMFVVGQGLPRPVAVPRPGEEEDY